MDLRSLAATVWRRRWVVVTVVVVATAASVALAATRPERYEATTTVVLTPNTEQGQVFLGADNLAALLETYAATAESDVNRVRAERILGRPLGGEIDASPQAGTGVLEVSVIGAPPRAVQQSANAVARAFLVSLRGNRLVVGEIVNPAQLPTSAVQPRPPLIISAAVLLGLVVGIVLALAVDRFRRRVETVEDVAEITRAPILGTIGRARGLERGHARVVWSEPGMMNVQENMRALRANVEFLVKDLPSIVQVTSPSPEQGKSTIAANLAVAMAQIGLPTILVDGDLRRPIQSNVFGVTSLVDGMSGYLAHGGMIEPTATSVPNLSIVPSGQVNADSTELLHVRLRPVLSELRTLDSLVIIDSPPLLPVSDARLIAAEVDGVILVVGTGTRPSELRAAVQKLEFVDANLMGIVLNRSKEKHDRDVGYYGYGPSTPDPQAASTG